METAEPIIIEAVRTRSYGAVRVARIVARQADPGGSIAPALVLQPETYASQADAEQAVRKGEPGEWAIIRLVSTFNVARETIVKAVVTEGPSL